VISHFKYLWYLLRHKWYVFVAGLHTDVPIWRLFIHDWSKFLPSEWIPYVQYFYQNHDGEFGDAQCRFGCAELAPYGFFAEDRFNVAWNLHQKRQPHHWQFWVLLQDCGESLPLPIPDHFIREMVADWAGAGRAITGKWEVCSWYAKHKNEMRLRTEVRDRIEELLSEHFGPIPVIHTAPEPLRG
jgi:hypothetical protein